MIIVHNKDEISIIIRFLIYPLFSLCKREWRKRRCKKITWLLYWLTFKILEAVVFKQLFFKKISFLSVDGNYEKS